MPLFKYNSKNSQNYYNIILLKNTRIFVRAILFIRLVFSSRNFWPLFLNIFKKFQIPFMELPLLSGLIYRKFLATHLDYGILGPMIGSTSACQFNIDSTNINSCMKLSTFFDRRFPFLLNVNNIIIIMIIKLLRNLLKF